MRIRPWTEMDSLLARIDGRGYPAYRDLSGGWSLPVGPAEAELWVDRVQPDPFAPPSRLRLRLSARAVGLPDWAVRTRLRQIASADFFVRSFDQALRKAGRPSGGTGHSGAVEIDVGDAEILDRTAGRVSADMVELRFGVGLPAAGRRVLGREAATLLGSLLPGLVQRSLLEGAWSAKALEAHLVAAEDHAYLQEALPGMGLVAFVANGAILPRASGVSQRPLAGAIPWRAPADLACEVDLPGAGRVSGTGIPEGITLIVGGGYHGKSTLLRALERGVYPHIPGDGREQVATRADAWKLRAEDGRSVSAVDISGFIDRLPGGTDTRRFGTESASGSTSMAANLVEALEAGSRLLLIDEDTSASNFLVRDARMQALVPGAIEPITPLIDRVQSLHRDLGVSTVMVVGGAGDYLDVADQVILMENYQPRVVTREAREVAARMPTGRQAGRLEPLSAPAARWADPGSVPLGREGRTKVSAAGRSELVLGPSRVDLSGLEQLVDSSQTRAIGMALLWALQHGALGRRPLQAALQEALQEADRAGLEAWVRGEPVGNLARPRLLEMVAALNRIRSLRASAGQR
ncbi:MAG: ABC-ATPase domain-containing protein [Bacillota bacterium]